jgi:hypothetical protein
MLRILGQSRLQQAAVSRNGTRLQSTRHVVLSAGTTSTTKQHLSAHFAWPAIPPGCRTNARLRATCPRCRASSPWPTLWWVGLLLYVPSRSQKASALRNRRLSVVITAKRCALYVLRCPSVLHGAPGTQAGGRQELAWPCMDLVLLCRVGPRGSSMTPDTASTWQEGWWSHPSGWCQGRLCAVLQADRGCVETLDDRSEGQRRNC